jgi:hypothetical protein
MSTPSCSRCCAGSAAVVYDFSLAVWLLRRPAGTERMPEIPVVILVDG